jgi:hypothetical protein
MNVKQKIITLVLGMVIAVGTIGVSSVSPVHADSCAGVTTAIIHCSQSGGTSADAQNSGVWGLLLLALNIMTAGVGILAVGGIVYGSVMYASAGDKAEQTKKAIGIITNVVIGVVSYAMMYLLLNFLIPGGIFT